MGKIMGKCNCNGNGNGKGNGQGECNGNDHGHGNGTVTPLSTQIFYAHASVTSRHVSTTVTLF